MDGGRSQKCDTVTPGHPGEECTPARAHTHRKKNEKTSGHSPTMCRVWNPHLLFKPGGRVQPEPSLEETAGGSVLCTPLSLVTLT
jgi:hypothetical protein